MNTKFSYTDEDDKCYGLTGMVISLNVLEHDDMLQEVTLDSESGDSITFTPDFYFYSNPRFSAKIAWNEMLKQYQLLTGLIVGNILCRYHVEKRQPITPAVRKDIRSLVEEEGREMCQLEDDEISMVLDKTLNFMENIYTSSSVHRLARDFVEVIKKRRTLSGHDVIEELQMLRNY